MHSRPLHESSNTFTVFTVQSITFAIFGCLKHVCSLKIEWRRRSPELRLSEKFWFSKKLEQLFPVGFFFLLLWEWSERRRSSPGGTFSISFGLRSKNRDLKMKLEIVSSAVSLLLLRDESEELGRQRELRVKLLPIETWNVLKELLKSWCCCAIEWHVGKDPIGAFNCNFSTSS